MRHRQRRLHCFSSEMRRHVYRRPNGSARGRLGTNGGSCSIREGRTSTDEPIGIACSALTRYSAICFPAGTFSCPPPASGRPPVRCAVITGGDTRTPATDRSGGFIREALQDAGRSCVQYTIVPDAPTPLTDAIDSGVHLADALLMTGGTGISTRDLTVDVVEDLLEKPLPGFGELFRMLSFHDIGAAAILSRATAGLYRRPLLFCIPGSTNAVQLAMEELILPELPHLVS